MIINPNEEIKIVIDQNQLNQAFPDYDFPFLLNKAIKDISKKEGLKYIADELAALLKKDPDLQSVVCLTSRAIKTCGVYKIRVKKESNKGKRCGYRVVFLLITLINGGYVLDITDHNIQDDLTDKQKQFCNKLVEELNKEIKIQNDN